MYMRDAIKATIAIMEAPSQAVKIRSSYNLSALSFTPKTLAEAIKKHIPDFTMNYAPDFRQAIADSWPISINDQRAREDWGWRPDFDLKTVVAEMLEELKPLYQPSV